MVKESDIAISKQVFGFENDFSQYQRVLKLRISRVAAFDHAAAMSFLQDTFSIDPKDVRSPKNRSFAEPASEEVAFLSASLSLARSLLRDAGIPSFELEKIVDLSFDRTKKHRLIALRIAVVEHMPAELYISVYAAALRLMSEFTKPVSRRAPLKQLADELKESLIIPTQQKGRCLPADIFILRQAFERGIQINHCGSAVYRLGIGSAASVFARGSTERDSALGFRTAQDKVTMSNWLSQSGVPTPVSKLIATAEQAAAAAKEIGFPVVIKPADRDRGEGVTIDIGSVDQVPAAFESAKSWSDRILVQERVPGVCHRLVTFKHKFVFAFTRHPKAVVGDGATSVEDLIEKANQKREKQAEHIRGPVFPFDSEALECLCLQGLDSKSVPDTEQIVYLRRLNNPETGGHHEVVTETVHPDNVALAERVARLMRLESMGLDLISTDISQPWHETMASVAEVNANPQIGKNSAKAFVDATFEGQTGVIPLLCFIGGEAAWHKAISQRETFEDSGLSAFVTSGSATIGPGNKATILSYARGLFDRASFLLNDPGVDALILVVQDDEFLMRGRPALSFSRVDVVDREVRSFLRREQSLSEERIDELVRTLEAAVR